MVNIIKNGDLNFGVPEGSYKAYTGNDAGSGTIGNPVYGTWKWKRKEVSDSNHRYCGIVCLNNYAIHDINDENSCKYGKYPSAGNSVAICGLSWFCTGNKSKYEVDKTYRLSFFSAPRTGIDKTCNGYPKESICSNKICVFLSKSEITSKNIKKDIIIVNQIDNNLSNNDWTTRIYNFCIPTNMAGDYYLYFQGEDGEGRAKNYNCGNGSNGFNYTYKGLAIRNIEIMENILTNGNFSQGLEGWVKNGTVNVFQNNPEFSPLSPPSQHVTLQDICSLTREISIGPGSYTLGLRCCDRNSKRCLPNSFNIYLEEKDVPDNKIYIKSDILLKGKGIGVSVDNWQDYSFPFGIPNTSQLKTYNLMFVGLSPNPKYRDYFNESCIADLFINNIN